MPVTLDDMPSSQAEMNPTSSHDDTKRAQNRLKGIRYARAAGIAVGFFMIIWLPFNALRWGGEAPSGLLLGEFILFGLVAILLLLPWKRLEPTRWWKPLLGLFFFAVAAFAFTMVIDLIFQYILAADQGKKPAPPAFQSLLIFLILMQPPVLIFLRKPELLD